MINWAIFSVKFLDRTPEAPQLTLLHYPHLAAISGTFAQVNFAKTPKIIKAARSFQSTGPIPAGLLDSQGFSRDFNQADFRAKLLSQATKRLETSP
jgi:hypothetical protein